MEAFASIPVSEPEASLGLGIETFWTEDREDLISEGYWRWTDGHVRVRGETWLAYDWARWKWSQVEECGTSGAHFARECGHEGVAVHRCHTILCPE